MLVGASRWRSAEVCRSELGWSLDAQAKLALMSLRPGNPFGCNRTLPSQAFVLLVSIYWVPGTGLFPSLSCLMSGLSLIGRFGLLAGGSTPNMLSMLRSLRGWLQHSVGVQLRQGMPVPFTSSLSHPPRPLSCAMPSNWAFRSGLW